MLRISSLVVITILLCGCSVLTTQIPLGTAPGSPVASATSFRLWYDSAVSVGTPDGISLSYGSKSNENSPLGAFWMRSTLDALTALANSQAAQAAMSGYMMGSGSGLPALPAVGGQLPTGTNASALQRALQSAGCPLASKLSPTAFASLLSALAQSGTALNVESLLPLLGGAE